MKRGLKSVAGPDAADVAMMTNEMQKRYGGAVVYGVSEPTAKGTASLLTVWWLAPLVEQLGTARPVLMELHASCALPMGHEYNFWSYAYRLLWELDAKVRQQLGDDGEWL